MPNRSRRPRRRAWPPCRPAALADRRPRRSAGTRCGRAAGGRRRAPHRGAAADGTVRGRRRAPRATRSAPTGARRRRAAGRRRRAAAWCGRAGRAAPPGSPSPRCVPCSAVCTWMTLSSTSPNTSGLASSHECPPRTTWPSVPNVEQNVSNAASGISRSSSLHSTSTGSSRLDSTAISAVRSAESGEERRLEHRERVARHVLHHGALHEHGGRQIVGRRAQGLEAVAQQVHRPHGERRHRAARTEDGRIADGVDHHEVAHAVGVLVGELGGDPAAEAVAEHEHRLVGADGVEERGRPTPA